MWRSTSCRQPGRAEIKSHIQRNGPPLTPAQEDENADATRSSDTDDCYPAAIVKRGRSARQAGRCFRSPRPFSSIACPPALRDLGLLHSTPQPPETDSFEI